MKKILIGTHNQGKFKEIGTLISKNFKKISPLDLKLKSPKETGKTFNANSRLKVKYFGKFVNYPVISDDSGICIQALSNKPGVYTARFAINHGGFFRAMQFILKKMMKKQNRSAKFICSLSYMNSNKRITTANGIIYGKISKKILGKKGFGFDPIFIPNSYKKTFGEMSKSRKMKIDHRFLAFRKLKKKIKTL